MEHNSDIEQKIGLVEQLLGHQKDARDIRGQFIKMLIVNKDSRSLVEGRCAGKVYNKKTMA